MAIACDRSYWNANQRKACKTLLLPVPACPIIERRMGWRSLVGGIGDQAVGQEDKRQLLLVVKAKEVNRVED